MEVVNVASQAQRSFVSKTFKGLLDQFPQQPLPLFTTVVRYNETDSISSLMNTDVHWLTPDLRSIPLIGLDKEEAVKMVLDEVYCEDVTGKGKALIATARGMGTGKTRWLDEMLRGVLVENSKRNHSFILPIPLTFNSDWALRNDTSELQMGQQRGDVAIYTICARILSVFLGESMDVVHAGLQQLSVIANESMVVDVLNFIAQRANEANRAENRTVDGIVLLLDETMLLANAVHVDDPYEVFRRAVLGPNADGVSAVNHCSFGVTLAMTALKNTPLGFTLSQRVMRHPKLPYCLDPEEVVSQVWLPVIENEHINVTSDLRSKLLIFAPAICQIPRQVEYVRNQLRIKARAASAAGMDELSMELVDYALEDAVKGLRIRYTEGWPEEGVEKRLVASLILGKAVDFMGVEARDLVARSFFVNDITVVPAHADQKETTMMVPRASPLMVSIAASKSVEGMPHSGRVSMDRRVRGNLPSSAPAVKKILSPRPLPYLFHECATSILAYIRNVTFGKKQKLGSLLESMMKLWLEIRMQALKDVYGDKSSFKLNELLAGALDKTKFEDVLIDGSWTPTIFKWEETSSSRNPDKLLQALSLVSVNEREGFSIIHPGPKDCFDVGIVVFRPGDKPLTVLIDCKSSRLSGKTGLKQATFFYDQVQPRSTTTNWPDNTCAAAIKNGDAVFLYLDTRIDREIERMEATKLSAHAHNVSLVIRATEFTARKMFTFFYDLFEASERK